MDGIEWPHAFLVSHSKEARKSTKHPWIFHPKIGSKRIEPKTGDVPGTLRPTIYKWMEMVITNHFPCKDFESSNWNNHKKLVGLRVPGWYNGIFLFISGVIFSFQPLASGVYYFLLNLFQFTWNSKANQFFMVVSIGWFKIFTWEMVGNHQTSIYKWLFRVPGRFVLRRLWSSKQSNLGKTLTYEKQSTSP